MPLDYSHEHTSRQIMDADNVKVPISPSGGSISATDGQIVFMDGTDAVGSADLTYLKIMDDVTIGINADENGSVTITGIGPGVQLFIQAAAGGATHIGGELTLASGGSAGQSGGDLTVQAGADNVDGDGGNINIHSGSAVGGQSGEIQIKAGGSGNSAVGGRVLIQGGAGQTGDGGHVTLQAGNKITSGTHGLIRLYSAEGTHSLELSETLGFQFFGGVVTLDGLPTANPNVAGQLWSDAGTLKVSAG